MTVASYFGHILADSVRVLRKTTTLSRSDVFMVIWDKVLDEEWPKSEEECCEQQVLDHSDRVAPHAAWSATAM
jgi:hypothetical protein